MPRALIAKINAMKSVAQQKAWIAKIVGSCYFILIGFVFGVMELVSGNFDFFGFCVLLWSVLPILINRRWMYLCFGSFNLLIWSYVGIAIIAKGIGGLVPLIVISSVVIGAIIAAFLLIYSAISISEKQFSLI